MGVIGVKKYRALNNLDWSHTGFSAKIGVVDFGE
jgi:hypothetical protein